jgi:hypothetical protein
LGVAQKPGAPCCSILSLEPPHGVLVRNNTTGQTFEFKVDASEYGRLKAGDAITLNAATKKITAIKGVGRSYPISQPNPATPCCSVTNVMPAPDVPCCGMVGVHDDTNNKDYMIKVDKSVANQLKAGQPVFKLEPGDGYKFQPIDGYQPVDGIVIFKLGTGNNASFYSYPMGAQGSGNSTGKTGGLNTATYELIKNPSLKGATGKLFLKLPADAEFIINKVLASGDKKYIGQFFKGDNIGLFPGSYDVYIYGAEVPNVKIQKGAETRLKVGVLNLTDALDYRVYGPNGNTYVELFTGPKKVGLPVGLYSVTVSGQSQEVTIKDGEVTDF